LNKTVVEYAMRMALATHCTIAKESRFARKNYFYPDLPKGYQISQYELPLAEHGWLDVDVNGQNKRIGITRIHMEEDAGKLGHDPLRPVSRVDLNRTGVPLMEIVSEPDIRTPEEAGAYLRQLRNILRYLEICDGNMEEGSFRCDANVSVRPRGAAEFGTRTELKNMNSFRNVEKAVAYEISRQTAVIRDGKQVIQETRLWDAEAGRTESMRGKEDAHDYRYFPDPDLLPLVINEDWIKSVAEGLPELPDAKKKRFEQKLGLSSYDAGVLTASRELADFLETVLSGFSTAKQVCNWVAGPLLALLNSRNLTASQSPVSPSRLARLLQLVDEGVISANTAKVVFEQMAAEGREPDVIVKEKGLVQVRDSDEIAGAVSEVLAANPQEVAAYKAGKTKVFGFLVGQVMKKTKGKADPKLVNSLLQDILSSKEQGPK
jgi:aspartyl-tRNA(Asn)/glutamyl-tRNA(Gln) amidotransferase subunit B